jgi:hypothetical protein
MHISNGEELVTQFKESLEPSEEDIAAGQEALALEKELQQSQINAFQGQANESNARAEKTSAEADSVPMKLEIDRIEAITRNLGVGDADDKEFEKRLRIADTRLNERKVAVQEKTALIKAVKEKSDLIRAVK